MIITQPLSIRVSLAFAVAVSLILTGCGDDEQKVIVPSVIVIEVQHQTIGNYREFVARTEAVEEVDLRARIEGYLIRRAFIEGDRIKKGQLLFKIDPAPFESVINQAKAKLNSSKAKQTWTKKSLVRGKELLPQGFISQSDMDTLTSNHAQASASVQARKAELESAQINLSYTEITAPFPGEIGKARYSVGNFVGPSSEPLATLTSIDPMYVSFSVNDKDLLKSLDPYTGNLEHRNDFDLSLRLPTGDEFPHPGLFNFANTRADETTATINMRAEFPNPNGILLPGLYVTLIAESKKKADVPLIPQATIQENQQGRFVLVVTSDNQVKRRIVEMGRRIGPMWVVSKGLEAGERIIIEGLQKVRPGTVVNPVVKSIDIKTGTLIDSPEQPSSPATDADADADADSDADSDSDSTSSDADSRSSDSDTKSPEASAGTQ
ncbi:MAG: efflux RND transporter periplasmic adaptor subunit [Endozoicomonadaceae bacterium]|nr:efflux RND transporter periplasmic adaptor subunit [Endozoicomonadaceae bacterium]